MTRWPRVVYPYHYREQPIDAFVEALRGEDIEVVVEGDVLTITAQRQERTEDRSATGYRSEFRYGRSSRQVRLPEGTSASM